MKIKVLKSNNSVEEVELAASIESNLRQSEVALVNRVRNQALKQGTKKAKTRSEVVGHSAKPFRQKGTGKARQGSTKSPHHVGGGVAHGPRPDFTKLRLNKKFKDLTLRKILQEALKNESVKFINLKEIDKTYRKPIEGQGKTLVIYSEVNRDLLKTLRNLSNIEMLNWSLISPFNLLNCKNFLIDLECKDELEKLLSK